MKFTIVGTTYTVNRDKLEKVAKATFSHLEIGKREGEIELKFVSEAEIQRLNKVYRGIDKPTDVLSFNVGVEPLAGQIVICYTYTVSQAKRLNKPVLEEFALLTVHGILHIFGYDHLEQSEEAEMQRIEQEILNTEGIER